tara:strand:+ start:277 stop:624 length:348 start_codon:yes stop_codon:yes gene_type:complete
MTDNTKDMYPLSHSVLHVIPYITSVFNRDCSGGGLHIVLDDYNIDDSSINSCVESYELTDIEKLCATELLKLSEEERLHAVYSFENVPFDEMGSFKHLNGQYAFFKEDLYLYLNN